jgi:predicted small metal-binding protein
MIRDCGWHAETAYILERLAEIVEHIERWDRIYDEQLQDAIKYRKAWTDPRSGITYFPPKEHSK